MKLEKSKKYEIFLVPDIFFESYAACGPETFARRKIWLSHALRWISAIFMG